MCLVVGARPVRGVGGLRLEQPWLHLEEPLGEHVDHLGHDGERRAAWLAAPKRRRVRLRVHLSQEQGARDGFAVLVRVRVGVRVTVTVTVKGYG